MAEDFVVTLLISSVKAGTALLPATLGEIFAERSGVLNLGVEGMMATGALAAFATANLTGDILLALAVALAASGCLSLVHGFISISLKANQVLSGLALTLLGLGLSGYLGKSFVGKVAPRIRPIPATSLESIPFLGPILFRYNGLVYGSFVLALVLWFILYRSRPGLNIRSVGESPATADSLGISVSSVRYYSVLVGGVLAGLSGAYLSLAYTPTWTEGLTAGRGWIAVALVVFARWDPLRALLGAYLFGGVEALQFRLQAVGVPVRPEFLLMLPYILTIVALTVSSMERLRRRVGTPTSLGTPYHREEG